MKRFARVAALILTAFSFALVVRAQNISTFAGGGNTFSGAASSLPAGFPYKVSQKDSSGNYYIASIDLDRILKVNAAGQMSPFAGNGQSGYSGNGGPAINASLNLNGPGSGTVGVALDSAGNVYFSDAGNEVVRVVNTQSSAIVINGVSIQPGNIQTVAGRPCEGACPMGDGGPATSAVFDSPSGVAVDSAGNIYVTDSGDEVVRVVNTQASSITIFNVTIAAGDIKTIAGNVSSCTPFSANGAQATTVCAGISSGLALDGSGNLYIAAESARIFEVIKTSGALNSVAGTGTSGYSGDGAAATSAKIAEFPGDVAIDSAGNIFIADSSNNAIREVTKSTGKISTVSGTGVSGYNGDGIASTTAELNDPRGVAVDSADNILIADTANYRIRQVTNSTGKISTVAGNGWIDYNGDGVLATNTDLLTPTGVAVDGSGNVFISDGNQAIREVAAGATPTITTVAGDGMFGFSGDGGAATSASICYPGGVGVGGPGNSVFFADIDNEVVREVSGGIISAFAGFTDPALPCPGFPLGALSSTPVSATSAYLDSPGGVAVDATGDVFIADTQHNVIVEVQSGELSVIAGNGTASFSGDGGAATSAELNAPYGVALDGNGNLFFADTGNNRVREVNLTSRIINTVAGNGTAGYNGEGTATSAELDSPEGVAVDSFGDIFIADTANNRIREVTAGVISTVAGDGSFGYNGDGIPATSAWLANPTGVVVDTLGNLYIADYGNSRVRKVPALQVTSTGVGSTPNPSTYGQSVTFTATVTAGSGTPAGSVNFYDAAAGATCASPGSSLQIGVAQTLGGGTASVTTTTLTVAVHTILACYTPTGNFVASSGTLSPAQTVSTANQATLTVTGPLSVTYGTTGAATASGGSGTGALSFSAGSSTGCSITGPNTVNVTNASGTCSIIATMAADGNYNLETSAPFNVTLVKANQTAVTATGPLSVTYGTTGAATASGGSGTGTLSFSAGSSTGCSITGTNMVNVTNASGTCSITATMAGDNNYNAGTASSPFTVMLGKAALSITPDGGKSKTFGTIFTAFSGVVSGLVSPDAVTVTYSSAGAASNASVGTYTITVGSANFTTGNAANYSIIQNTAANGLTVIPGPASQIVFASAPLNLTAGQCSSAITITSEDFFGNLSSVSASTLISLSSSSSAGTFFSDSGCTMPVSSESIAAGSNGVTFYYEDTKAGTPSITAGSTGLGSPAQQETINPGPASQLGITTAAFAILAGQCSSATTVTSLDQFANASNVAANTQVNLSAASGGGKFYSDSACLNQIVPSSGNTFVTVPSGSSSASFYYADSIANTPANQATAITASDNNGGAGSLGSTNQPETILHLAFTTSPFEVAENQCSGQITLASQGFNNSPATITLAAILGLTSTSAGGTFYSDSACTNLATPSGTPLASDVTIAGGGSSISFSYKDTIAGGPTLTAGIGAVSLSQQETTGNAPSITSANNTTFTVNAAGTFAVQTTGAPTPTLSETGGLPGGVTFVDNHNGTATLSGTPALGSVTAYPITINAANGLAPAASQSFTLTVQKANQTAVTVTGPLSVTYGTIGAATASGGSGTGALSFSAGSSTGCSITGSNTVNVTNASGTCLITATMAADSNYNSSTSTLFNVTLVKANQTAVTVNGPASVTYGTTGTATASGGSGTGALSFSAGSSTGCSITGTNTVNVTNASGTCSITATMAADSNYNSSTSTLFNLTLVKANQAAVTATGPLSVTYGTTGTATASGGSGTGTLTFSAGSSTGCSVTGANTVNVANASGPCAITATKAADNNYNISNMSAPFTVTLVKATPTITFGAAPAATYPGSFTVSAATNSDGALNYSVVTGQCALASGATFNTTAAGSCTIQASTPITSNFLAGTTTQLVTIASAGKITPTITWSTPAAITYGTYLSRTQLDATASVAGTFVYSPAAGAALTAGSHVLTVTFTPTNTSAYTSTTAEVTLQVNQAKPVVVWIPIPIVYGNPLGPLQLDALVFAPNSATQVPGTIAYSPVAGTIVGAGSHQLSMTFTPRDTIDYTSASTQATLLVAKATPNITWSQPAPIVNGTPLSATQLNATATVPGTFTYTPPKGTVLPIGTYRLQVTFTPTDTSDYQVSEAVVGLTVKSH